MRADDDPGETAREAAGRARRATLVDGAVGGGIATVVMSLALLGARRAGLVGQLPPEHMTARLLDAAGLRAGTRTQDTLATLLHGLFGVAAGALFGLVRRHPRVPLPSVAQGVVYGGLVWLVSYMGWIPALGLMPAATRDEPRRPVVMVLAHGIYGAVLGALVGRRPWRRGAPSRRHHT